jgi:hypothetical protein
MFPEVSVSTGDLSQDFYGMASGDFNRSFTPGTALTGGSASLTLSQGQVVSTSPSSIVDVPVRASHMMEVGAVSLILDYPNDMVEILGVSLMNNPNLPLLYQEDKGVLRIGWTNPTPMMLATDDILLTIRVKTSQDMLPGDAIVFSLAQDPLNELADGRSDVIQNAELYTTTLAYATVGIGNQEEIDLLHLSSYPNPFTDQTSFSFDLPERGDVSLEITDLAGKRIALLLSEPMNAGSHSYTASGLELSAGVYMATLRLSTGDQVISRSVRIVRR